MIIYFLGQSSRWISVERACEGRQEILHLLACSFSATATLIPAFVHVAVHVAYFYFLAEPLNPVMLES